MKFLGLFGKNKKRTVVIVQCRLSSTRLPQKALLPLGDKTVLEWTLAAMKKVPADKYYLAVDEESAERLKPIAEKCGWNFFAGSKEDVLDRFCKVIELSKAETVVRATADNPFLFFEAASELLKEFESLGKNTSVDYITYTGLPHGSGIEIFSAQSLLKAASQTNDPYDHEHVGPSLYNHRDRFNSQFLKAPEQYNRPNLRTTIDTAADYRRAQRIVHILSDEQGISGPYKAHDIIRAMDDERIRFPMLLLPSVQKGRGTGHLHRCLSLAIKTGADVYIPQDASLEQSASLIAEAEENGFDKKQIVYSLDHAEYYSLAVTDSFITPHEEAEKLSAKCPVVSLDEGAGNTDYADYLLDIIPSLDLGRKANLSEPGFMEMPKRVRKEAEATSQIHTALVVLGGEDPAALSLPAATALAECNVYVTLISDKIKRSDNEQYIKVIEPVKDLKEKLSDYDLVVTHYGFTAFEAAAAGCAVILLATTSLHEALAKKYGFACLPQQISPQSFKKLLAEPGALRKKIEPYGKEPLNKYLISLSHGHRLNCPVCLTPSFGQDSVVARIPQRTFRRCSKCGMLYMAWTSQSEQTEYNRDYFFSDYEKQYGKTYLDDFASIKAQGIRRTSIIDMLYRHSHSSVTPTILDIGCAMGPFMDAANDAGWQVFGTDVARSAVDYVTNELHFPAICAAFPKVDVTSEFGIDKFDAVTLWYVIEHFQNLDEVLKAVAGLVKKGGIFAFSTPSAAGVSGKYNTQSFFENSPADHYTLWEPSRAASILRRYGFKVVKIVSTGIHPERFPLAKKHGWKEKSVQFRALKSFSRILKLGDTFEVYCKKVR